MCNNATPYYLILETPVGKDDRNFDHFTEMINAAGFPGKMEWQSDIYGLYEKNEEFPNQEEEILATVYGPYEKFACEAILESKCEGEPNEKSPSGMSYYIHDTGCDCIPAL